MSKGYISKFNYNPSDVAQRIKNVDWFSACGKSFTGEVSMPIQPVSSWAQAQRSCRSELWENVQLEAQNQLTIWLHHNDRTNYQKWNDLVTGFKSSVINPLVDGHIRTFLEEHGLDGAIEHCVSWDLLAALMENAYFGSGHKVFFFLELLTVYEAGHFPCGWEGDWPEGELMVY
ncbi:hypothetical protein JXQ70_16890 [bacterium]|nr:hypothetical protein [bacterium]